MARSRKPTAPRDEDSDLEDVEDVEEEVDESPANKRQRTSTTYPRGTVKQVKVFNFMTYGEPAVVIKPGPRLNLVLGPNGTGKSSLVCALCVGLAGSTKLLGRADNVKDYIRRGCTHGWVETTLSGGPGQRDHVVRCDLIKSSDTYRTEWRLNSASCTKKDIQELVKSLNIQFDNLCQFLPQDKVVEFARMDQYELLVATEKAIGDATLYETHQRLIAKRNAVKDQDAVLAATKRRHEQLVAENQRLERDYERFKRREKLQDRIDVMKRKVVWMGVKEAQEKSIEAAAAQKEAEQDLKKAKEEAKSDERPAARRQKEADDAKRIAAEIQKEVTKFQNQAQAASNKLADLETDVRTARQELDGLQAQSDKLKEEKETYRQKIEKGNTQLASMPPVPDHSARQTELGQEMQNIRDEVARLETEKGDLNNSIHHAKREILRLQALLRECDSAKYQRLHTLKRTHKGMQRLEEALQWVNHQRQQGVFRGEVAGPLALEMQIKIGACAHYLEQATFGQLCNFAVQNKDDEDIISKKFKELGVRSNVITVPVDLSQRIVSKAAQMRNYGVVCSVDEVYDAPPLVKHCLVNMCDLPNVYIVNHDDTDQVRRLMDEHGVRQVYTTKRKVNFIKSAYGGREDASVTTSDLVATAGQILGGGGTADIEQRKAQINVDLQQANQQHAHFEQQLASKDSELQPLNQRLEELQAEKNELARQTEAARRQRANLVSAIKQLTHRLEGLEKRPDPLNQAPDKQRKLTQALNAHYRTLCQQLTAAEGQWEALQRHSVAELTYRELDMQAKGLLAAVTARKAAIQNLERALQVAQLRARQFKQQYDRLKQEAAEEHALQPQDTQRFASLPNDREELEEVIQECQAELANISVNNPRVVEEYKKRQQEIEKLARELQALENEVESAKAEIESLKASWQPELERVIGLINSSFSTNFAHIGCAGEVLLGTDPDYDKFSIQIMVKFREHEQLELLTAHRQSGGERSVSTILYLIALQGVTVTPFRVVDEINQGMDPINERKVFMQLVEASCQEGTPQCFLLTPKLLPDLPFTEDITVLNIFNGGLIAEQVAGQYSKEALFGTKNLAALQRVPVAG